MFKIITNWFQNRFSDPDAITLTFIILFSFLFLWLVGDILAPVLVAIVIAYLLEWPIHRMTKMGARRSFAVASVMFVFIWLCVISFLGLTPLIWHQLGNLISEIPHILEQGQNYLLNMPSDYPSVINAEQIKYITNELNNQLVGSGKAIVSASVNSLFTAMALLIYLVLVPLLVFFMLADKDKLIRHWMRLMPTKRRLAIKVWSEMNQQIGKYIQGKVIEILIVGTASVIAFWLLDLRYAVLLGVAVGLSVLIPYIGAAVVTIPVAVVALFQFGGTSEFWYVMIVYGIIQAIDGNVIVPILFSQAVNLHPVYIIIAVLFFGGIWGFWGVFFAIPLATLVKAIINAWPVANEEAETSQS
ncbi:AI-2E family transporter [Catenovulum maritimum]|uniref:Permase n=1 Tax=Catenovulum maritimum TaxID=1513271 RepID=A0A0J8GQE5_9ALTE|nr:AI-2E family transporter [Catenovulum maritimum]KMT64962.1 permase [Catenovulum maritimum]